MIVGGGFAGLHAARQLGKRQFPVTLVDRRNFHLFQPLLYQLATGYLASGDIAAPLRSTLARHESVNVVLESAMDVDPERRILKTGSVEIPYDILIAATGVTHSYFGHDAWQSDAPGLKSVEDAIEIRRRVLSAFEIAERTADPKERERLLTFVIVGGGPTGVELAGTLAELARGTLSGEYRNFNPGDSKIHLFEGGDRILSSFHEKSANYAERTLSKLGVQVHTSSRVQNVAENGVQFSSGGGVHDLPAATVIWAAGVTGSSFGQLLKSRYGAELDRSGRVIVTPHLHLPGDENVFVLGDLANVRREKGDPFPGLAPVAIQQGQYVARLLEARTQRETSKPFYYFDKGNMAVIGRGRAVAETGRIRLRGFPAWLAWAFIHIYFLIEFENKIVVFWHWVWNYLTNKRGSRIITEKG